MNAHLFGEENLIVVCSPGIRILNRDFCGNVVLRLVHISGLLGVIFGHALPAGVWIPPVLAGLR